MESQGFRWSHTRCRLFTSTKGWDLNKIITQDKGLSRRGEKRSVANTTSAPEEVRFPVIDPVKPEQMDTQPAARLTNMTGADTVSDFMTMPFLKSYIHTYPRRIHLPKMFTQCQKIKARRLIKEMKREFLLVRGD
jgi:hypothetical protein